MSVAIVTGANGLVGSESVARFAEGGFDVVGIDNDLRAYFFGPRASTRWKGEELRKRIPGYRALDADIRDQQAMQDLFAAYGDAVEVVIHAAAQPSHDWAAREPLTDFSINAVGTHILLEMCRQHCPGASFVFVSTNKVYGDRPNDLPLVEEETRYEIAADHPYHDHGIDEGLSIDRSQHSLFGASKVAADVLVQEYGRYFGMNTVCFRGGCLTGPGHSGAELHGFLAYLADCGVKGRPYTIYGYGGKQVRDNIHGRDLVDAFWHYTRAPRPGEVYNIGGSRFSNCSVLEAIERIEAITGRAMSYTLDPSARQGDHQWWISDVRRFQRHYPDWRYRYSLDDILEQLVAASDERR